MPRRNPEHQALAVDAADKIREHLTRLDPYPGSHNVEVYGKDPPSLCLRLSVVAAYHLIDAFNKAEQVASR